MKKLLYITVLAALIGCGKGDIEPINKKIVGTWN
jgi:hypothetical protein